MKQFNSSSILSSTIIGLSIVISSFIVAGVNFSSEEQVLKATSSYEGMMFPVIRIDGEIYVGTEELKEWVHQAVSLKKEYDLKL